MRLDESSPNDLYRTTVRAFPKTTRRQHATQPIKIETLDWMPFVGMKTLFIKGLARNEDRQYNTIVLFKGVDYEADNITIAASDGMIYSFAPLSLERNDINVRCSCPDFSWRFNYYNHLDKSLQGPKRKKYEGTTGVKANPLELPGLCKHLLKTIQVLKEARLFSD